MQPDFWHERWQLKQIGFHQQTINPYLQRFWQQVAAPAQGRVFVPLCGKSYDMVWLRQQGYDVVGVELSEIAVHEFFAENDLQPTRRQVGAFTCFESPGYTLLCGDFFALDAATLGRVDAVYDRAAMVALPAEMRSQYSAHMLQLVPEGIRTLLIAFEYPQKEMNGPPFSVEEKEIRALYAARYEIVLLDEVNILDQEPRFRDKGVSRLSEKVYLFQD